MGTKKIYPNAFVPESPTSSPASSDSSSSVNFKYAGAAPEVLTVWRKSLLFNCSGFTVFDSDGNLAFRVDNYSASCEVVLMDADGNPLFTSRRKGRVFGPKQWMVYEGEGLINVEPRFSTVKKQHSSSSKALAHITPCCGGIATAGGYEVEGSYAQRTCTVYGEGRRRMADIRRKEDAASGADFGPDVFRLVVQPEMDTTVAMAIVVLLDQMFGSRGR